MAVLASGLTFSRAALAPAAPARRCNVLPSAAATAACEASQVAVAERCAQHWYIKEMNEQELCLRLSGAGLLGSTRVTAFAADPLPSASFGEYLIGGSA